MQQSQQIHPQNIVKYQQPAAGFIHECGRYYIEKISSNSGICVIKHVKLPKLDSQNTEIEYLDIIRRYRCEFNIVKSIDSRDGSDIQIYTEYQEYGSMSDCIKYWERNNQPVVFSV